MKYNTIDNFKHDLISHGLAPSTALTYSKAVDFLLKEQFLMDCRQLNIPAVITKLRNLKYKNQYSKYRNAFVKFCAYLQISLDDKTLIVLERMSQEKKKKRRRLQRVKLADMQNRIKVIRDKKLKLSFYTMLATGLRVSELSQITPLNCTSSEPRTIQFSFIGKGGEPETVCVNSERLVTGLKELIQNTPTGKTVFYSTPHLQQEANKRGFKCHDLRRAFAKLEYKKTRDVNHVKRLLRHVKVKNTKIYLNSKIDI